MRLAIAGAMLLAAAPAAAADNAALFAARPSAFWVSLSPEGDRIAFMTAFKTGGRAVIVADVATGKSTTAVAANDLSIRPQRCGFKTQTRLICTVSGVAGKSKSLIGFTRVIAVDTDGKNVKILGQQERADDFSRYYAGGGVIDWLPDDPDHVLMNVYVNQAQGAGTKIQVEDGGLGAAIVDVRTGFRRIVERSNALNAGFATDGHGEVRLRGSFARDPTGYVRNRFSYSVRAKGSRVWLPLAQSTLTDPSATVADGFDESGDNVLMLKKLDGRLALYRVAIDGSGREEMIFAHPKVDLDGVLRIGKFNRPVGVEYTLDNSEVAFFDDRLKALSRSLTKALPEHPRIAVYDESWDGSKKLIYADTDNAPGRYYLYDGATKQLGELVARYPALAKVALGKIRAISYAARDGVQIPGYLTLPPGKADATGLPAVVMPHGGPSARDSTGFDWLAQFFAAEGYAVLQPNFRGSTGYGEDFFAKNGFQSWPLAMGDINDGARWLIAQGADARRLAIVGWSYGGYAALQANVAEPQLYRAAIAIAPVADLALLREESLDADNYKLIDAMIGRGPHVESGSPDRHAGRFVAPVLMFHADQDLNVDIEQSRVMARALKSAGKRVELIEYKGLDHQIDDSEARRDMLSRSADFLKTALE